MSWTNFGNELEHFFKHLEHAQVGSTWNISDVKKFQYVEKLS